MTIIALSGQCARGDFMTRIKTIGITDGGAPFSEDVINEPCCGNEAC
jgi:hypothetical protein